jgi:hypothetical protein
MMAVSLLVVDMPSEIADFPEQLTAFVEFDEEPQTRPKQDQ